MIYLSRFSRPRAGMTADNNSPTCSSHAQNPSTLEAGDHQVAAAADDAGHQAADDDADDNRQVYSSTCSTMFSFIACTITESWMIWRLPMILARNSKNQGCLAPLIIWIISIGIWSVPMTSLMLVLGRHTGAGLVSTFRTVAGRVHTICAVFATIVILLIASYTSVLCGWSVYFTFRSVQKALPGTLDASKHEFYRITSESSIPVITHALVASMSGVIVSITFEAGKVLIPVACVLFVWIPMYCSLTAVWTDSQIADAMNFLFRFDSSSFFDIKTWADVALYSAMDVGLASGILLAHAGYCKKSQSVVKMAWALPFISAACRLLGAVILFAVVFAATPTSSLSDRAAILAMEGDGNTGLTFNWLPFLFSEIFDGDLRSKMLAFSFYCCISLLGLISQITLTETVVRSLQDVGVPRLVAALVTVTLVFILGCATSLSEIVRNNQVFVWSHVVLVSALFLQTTVLTIGWKKFRNSIAYKPEAPADWTVSVAWCFVVSILLPSLVVCLLFYWWIYFVCKHHDKPEKLAADSFSIILLEWLLVIFSATAISVAVFRWPPDRWNHNEDADDAPDNFQLTMRPPPYTASDPLPLFSYGQTDQNGQTNNASSDTPTRSPPSYWRTRLFDSLFGHRTRFVLDSVISYSRPPPYSVQQSFAQSSRPPSDGEKPDESDTTSAQCAMTYNTRTQTPATSRESMEPTTGAPSGVPR
ncbi:sodium- and chloride-dependent GABA transporter ine-like [Tubulanus polymorphus]|uniref:sodium- and chloride-dependent GABA transporter ine-like n=1 Tax=Tubulanus polymorphus TaxID=672921 RepID=UPI003DA45818